MPLPFNKSLDIKLLHLVKEYPILYNPTHTKYVDFDSREVVWQKIGDALGRPAPVCKSRWVNIRDMMRRKVRERLRNPNQRSYNYKYEDELKFMLPYYKDCANTSEDYTEFAEEQNHIELEVPTEVYLEESEYDSETLEVKPNIKQMKSKLVQQPHEDLKEHERNIERSHDMNPTDPLEVFLMTIGSTLRKFSPYYLNQAKSKIFQVVQDYELQQIVNKEDPPSHSNANR
ncbi:uncharacterized protein LOC126377789 [Pectinophora gossypiella]|nr:uncharacterized protein LOC126377789 [Pectinophora gossypiella]